MSMYGEDGDMPYRYKKEDMHDEIETFLEEHKLSELMSIISDVLNYSMDL